MPVRLILKWMGENQIEQEFELVPGTTVIGRAADNDVVLPSPMVSRTHARIIVDEQSRGTLEDLGSRNGTFLDGERITTTEIQIGDELGIGGISLVVTSTEVQQPGWETVVGLDPHSPDILDAGVTVVPGSSPGRGARVSVAPTGQPSDGGIPEAILAAPLLSERALKELGIDVQIVEVATLGAGIGSFVFVDLLRASGMAKSDIAALGIGSSPMARWARLCENSQIPTHERIRSNSESTPDNIWGFPGYAVREGVREFRRGHIRTGLSAFWSVFGEPVMARTYTPKLRDVVSSVDHEAQRIGWPEMLRHGRIRAIRKSEEGRLVAILSQSDADQRRYIAVSARVMHLSIGYPAVQLLPDLAAYRESHGDFERVVNAYEPHAPIYERLRERGGVVLLRGRGIVASRVLQRLYEERQLNPKIQVIHLHRSRLTAGHRYGFARRCVDEQYEFQPFNWPKSCWGGEFLDKIERSSPEDRKALLDVLGGTSTANRRDWRQIVTNGGREGWYRSEFGTVESVEPTVDGRVNTRIHSTLGGGGDLSLIADFVIDCTGLVAAARRSPLLADLLERYQVPLNQLGRLAVTNDYELAAMRHGQSRMYASGALTLGGPMAAVDSFLGLQFTALRAVDAMQDVGIRGLRRLNGLSSVWQWWKWVRKAAP
ncbi:MAG: FHA domain-containing protein [Anaerolineaceae bacterium]